MDDKKVARLLRKQGFSYSEISQRLSRKRSKSTLSYWFRDIPLSEYQKEELRERFAEKLPKAREKSLASRKASRTAYLESIPRRNAGLGAVLKDPQVRKALLGALYLTGGAKKSGSLTFASSDPAIVRLYLYLLRTSYVLDESKFRCTILAQGDQSLFELKRYWSKESAIPLEQFYAPRVDARTYGKPTKKQEYKGVCRIDYISADLFLEVASIGTILTSSVRGNEGP